MLIGKCLKTVLLRLKPKFKIGDVYKDLLEETIRIKNVWSLIEYIGSKNKNKTSL